MPQSSWPARRPASRADRRAGSLGRARALTKPIRTEGSPKNGDARITGTEDPQGARAADGGCAAQHHRSDGHRRGRGTLRPMAARDQRRLCHAGKAEHRGGQPARHREHHGAGRCPRGPCDSDTETDREEGRRFSGLAQPGRQSHRCHSSAAEHGGCAHEPAPRAAPAQAATQAQRRKPCRGIGLHIGLAPERQDRRRDRQVRRRRDEQDLGDPEKLRGQGRWDRRRPDRRAAALHRRRRPA